MSSLLFCGLSILLFTFANLLRFARWNMLCNSGHVYQSNVDFHTYFLGRILNLLLPLKLGDTIRLLVVKRKKHLLPTLLILGIERSLDAIFFLILAIALNIKVQIDGLTLGFIFTITVVLAILFSFLRFHLAKSNVLRLSLWTLKRIVSRKVAIKSILYSLLITLCILFATTALSKSSIYHSDTFTMLDNQISVQVSLPALKMEALFVVILASCLIPSVLLFLNPNLFHLRLNPNKSGLQEDNISEIAYFEILNNRKFAKINLNTHEKIEKVFQGGSNAITYLTVGPDGFKVRKSAREIGMATLVSQFQYMKSFADVPAVPNVVVDQNSKNYFGYGLEYYETYDTLNEYLISRTDALDIFSKLRDHHGIIFSQEFQGDNSKIQDYFRPKFLRLYDLVDLNYDGYHVDSKKCKQFKTDVKFVESVVLNQIKTEKLRRSHGDFSASNILYDGRSFVYIDLLAPNEHSTIESDWGKLLLSLIIELEKRIVLQTRGLGIYSNTELTSSGINLSDNLQESLKNFYDSKNISRHALLHFVRVLPYRVKDPESAKYWFELLHETIDFLCQKDSIS